MVSLFRICAQCPCCEASVRRVDARNSLHNLIEGIQECCYFVFGVIIVRRYAQ